MQIQNLEMLHLGIRPRTVQALRTELVKETREIPQMFRCDHEVCLHLQTRSLGIGVFPLFVLEISAIGPLVPHVHLSLLGYLYTHHSSNCPIGTVVFIKAQCLTESHRSGHLTIPR